MIDPLDIQLARHLDEIDASDEKNEWINRRAKELMDGEYSYKRIENIIEAIGNTTGDDLITLEALIHQESNGLASFIKDLSWGYWCAQADKRAELEWQRR